MQESEWKYFRRLRVVALNRFCEKVLHDITQIAADATKSPHERYLEIYKVIQQRDQAIAEAFNNPRRSTAVMQLVAIHSHGLVNDDELNAFTQETRDVVLSISTQRA
jgi:hypothetical protein